MSEQLDLQVRFFQMIKERLEPHLSLVDEIADLLQVSNDSAYRRLRGETALPMNELAVIAKRFSVSVDAFIQLGNDEVIFNFQPLNETDFDFMAYLKYIEANMEFILKAEEKEVIYMANEIPLFHLMHSPELASFKLFFWQKTILDFAAFRNMKFKLNQKDDSVNLVSRNIRDIYCRVPSVEIYHSETIDTTLKQIEYYHVAGYFDKRDIALTLLDSLTDLVEHIKLQCEAGYKFVKQEDGSIPEYVAYPKDQNYTVYHNEVLHTDNTILVKLGDQFISFLTSNGISSLSTRSESFYKESHRALEILRRKSTLISGTSEKERNSVFLNYFDKIERLRKKLSQ